MEQHIQAPMNAEDARKLQAGDYVYITGTIYTARDAAHKRMSEALEKWGNPALCIKRKYYILYWTISRK